MARAAELVEGRLALVAGVNARRRRAGGALGDLGHLGHALVDARKRVRLVVDDDADHKLVELVDTLSDR